MHEPPWTDVAQAVAAILAIPITLFGLIAVFWQVRQLTKAIHSETHSQLTSQSVDVLALMASRPDCYAYLYEGDELPVDHPNREEILIIVEAVANYIDNVAQQKGNIPYSVWRRWETFAQDTIRSSPAVRDHLRRYRNWYSNELMAIYDKLR